MTLRISNFDQSKPETFNQEQNQDVEIFTKKINSFLKIFLC